MIFSTNQNWRSFGKQNKGQFPKHITTSRSDKAMAESPTGLSELEFLDLDDLNYETDIDVEILDGFHLENTLHNVNDKVQQFTFYWMKLYSNCCIQRDEALGLLRLGYVDDAIKKMRTGLKL